MGSPLWAGAAACRGVAQAAACSSVAAAAASTPPRSPHREAWLQLNLLAALPLPSQAWGPREEVLAQHLAQVLCLACSCVDALLCMLCSQIMHDAWTWQAQVDSWAHVQPCGDMLLPPC